MHSTKYPNYLLLLSIFLLSLPLTAQNPIVSDIISATNIDSLILTVEQLSGEKAVTLNGSSDTIRSRHKFQPGNEMAYRYLLQRLTAFGLQVDSFTFGVTGKNALAIQPGKVYPNRSVIICAHYDGMPPNDTHAPAADDNASSVATVIEAARILSQYEFEHTVIYALWDEEEQGLVGSNAYAVDAVISGDTILGVINMDAVAWDGDGDDLARVHTRPIARSLALADSVIAINQTYNIGLNMVINNPGRTYSDHASFWSQAYSAVLLIEDFDNDGNPYYHTTEDKVEHFDLPYYHKLASLSIGTIATLAVPVVATSISTVHQLPLQVYPNPASHSFSVNLGSSYARIAIEVKDALGRSVQKFSFYDREEVELDVASLPVGVYFLQVHAGERLATVKLIKS